MPSSLPSESALGKAVKDFGLGPYDGQSDASGDHGEDSEAKEPPGMSLPGPGPKDPQCPDRFLSYPEEPNARLGSWCRNIFAAAAVPGDSDRPRHRSAPSFSESPIRSVANPGSKLPADSDNPSSRSDGYDRTVAGIEDAWATEDTGAYVSQEKSGSSSLPEPVKAEEQMDNNLHSLGNWQSGTIVQDVAGPQGFPSPDFLENEDYDRDDMNDGGRIVASEGASMSRIATNISLVTGLTTDFLKEYGKKGLTKRHVLAFLQSRAQPQFLSSDVIRCLKLSHDIHVKDVLDEFPVSKKASAFSHIGSVREKVIQLEIDNIRDPGVSSFYRRCAADLSKVIADLERVGFNG
jgi:hypothetical protein